jgi:hypothetical protein
MRLDRSSESSLKRVARGGKVKEHGPGNPKDSIAKLACSCARPTHHAWNSGVELNIRATPTKQNFRIWPTRKYTASTHRSILSDSSKNCQSKVKTNDLVKVQSCIGPAAAHRQNKSPPVQVRTEEAAFGRRGGEGGEGVGWTSVVAIVQRQPSAHHRVHHTGSSMWGR